MPILVIIISYDTRHQHFIEETKKKPYQSIVLPTKKDMGKVYKVKKLIKLMENEQINEESEENLVKAMSNTPIYKKIKENEVILMGNLQKSLFYKKKKIEITFRLKNHQEYFISGKIISITESNIDENTDFLVTLELNNKEKAIYCSWEIDFETLTPSKYNPIRYFIREIITNELKNRIFERDSYICKLNLDNCSKKAEEIDHIIPISKGGLTIYDNLQAVCSNCNKKKSNNLIF